MYECVSVDFMRKHKYLSNLYIEFSVTHIQVASNAVFALAYDPCAVCNLN